MSANKTIFWLSINILLWSFPAVQAESDKQASALIHDAIIAAGGSDTWQQNGTLVVHETQTRNENEGTLKVNLVHYMNTMGKGYRIELSRSGENFVYGWDGKEFWATSESKSGGHELVNEARRVISDAYFRFSLPFILEDSKQEYKYSGTEMLDGKATEVINVSYAKSPADRYFLMVEKDHGHKEANAETGHGESSAGHGHGGEVYNFHINKQNQISKVYFSHHGDGTYETLLLEDFKSIDGILREHKRTLFRPDGKTHYSSEFTSIEFVPNIDSSSFTKP